MVDEYDFEFAPGMTNPYIPTDLIERDAELGLGSYDDYAGMGGKMMVEGKEGKEEKTWRPYLAGGYL